MSLDTKVLSMDPANTHPILFQRNPKPQPPVWPQYLPILRLRILPRFAARFAGFVFLVFMAAGVPTLQAQVAGAMDIWPRNSTVELGSTKQFGAYVPISPNTITWLVNDIPGGNATLGTISTSGKYTPPAAAPAANVVTIKARSTAFPSSFASTPLTITRKYPWLWSVYPSSLQVGPFEVSFNGANFAPDSKALANGVELATTYVSSTKLIATGTASQMGTLLFAVRQPAPGAVTGNTVSVTVAMPTVTVSVNPSSASVNLGASRTFQATVTGSANTSVTWSVNGTAGGSAAVGTISSSGVYTAPSAMPANSTVSVRATSAANAAAFANASVTLTVPPPITISLSPSNASIPLGGSQSFSATVSGTANTTVIWTVDGIMGGTPIVGTISSAGVYTAPVALPPSGSVTVRATSAANSAVFANAQITLTLPPNTPPPPGLLAAGRFLEQSSFGPTPGTLSQVQQFGITAYLDQQLAMPESPIPTPSGNSLGSLRQWALHHYTTAPDQLRQRVAYALSQIIVTSGSKLVYADEMLPWLRLLSQHAFGNYRDLLRNVTISPSMGKYLDLANSMKPGLAGGANENYPRELLQLFSIGLWMLNPDGTQALDGSGQPIPAYNQQTVSQLALALTGWTYPTAPGATPQNNNWEYFDAPMESRPQNHATVSKTFLGCTLPANQTVEQDLDSVIDCLMQHPNIAPFISLRLIRSLVMSNPSGAYVQRVAGVFENNGSGVRGDLKAVVRAILLDPEARNDTATPNQGRLKEPILQVCGLLRALNGSFSADHQLTYLFDYMGQAVLSPPSVFSWFSPLYRVPKNPQLFGPEFQIYTPTEATLRGNLMYSILNYPGNDMPRDLSPFQPYGNDMAGLVEQVNTTLLYGRMPAAMKQALITAAAPGYDAKTRIETVLYLTSLSGLYAVQH